MLTRIEMKAATISNPASNLAHLPAVEALGTHGMGDLWAEKNADGSSA